MWTCPRCGEKHQEQFDACWKCAGQAMPRGQPDTQTQPTRSLACVLPHAAFGLLFGAVVGGFVLSLCGVPFEAALRVGGLLGLAAGMLSGVLSWVMYPFQPPANDGDEIAQQ
jgi:hypothetical protein